MNNRSLCIYVDGDDTFVRSSGSTRIPIPAVIAHIRSLSDEGAQLYCWSSGGAEYAKHSAQEFGIADCFLLFLPKPQVAIDDLQFNQWRNLVEVHPNECHGNTIDTYREKIVERKSET